MEVISKVTPLYCQIISHIFAIIAKLKFINQYKFDCHLCFQMLLPIINSRHFTLIKVFIAGDLRR